MGRVTVFPCWRLFVVSSILFVWYFSSSAGVFMRLHISCLLGLLAKQAAFVCGFLYFVCLVFQPIRWFLFVASSIWFVWSFSLFTSVFFWLYLSVFFCLLAHQPAFVCGFINLVCWVLQPIGWCLFVASSILFVWYFLAHWLVFICGFIYLVCLVFQPISRHLFVALSFLFYGLFVHCPAFVCGFIYLVSLVFQPIGWHLFVASSILFVSVFFAHCPGFGASFQNCIKLFCSLFQF